MTGLFMSEDYVYVAPDNVEMNVASIVWGISITFTIFTFSKATKQTFRVWKRKKGINGYIIMVWLEWLACIVMSILSWLFLWGTIPPSWVELQVGGRNICQLLMDMSDSSYSLSFFASG